MERRSFLKFLLSTPLAAVIDYEKLLWVPGEKTIFIPEPPKVELYESFVLEQFNPSVYFSGDDVSFGGVPINAVYKRIGLDEAIKDGHIHPYEIPSISEFVKRVNNNA